MVTMMVVLPSEMGKSIKNSIYRCDQGLCGFCSRDQMIRGFVGVLDWAHTEHDNIYSLIFFIMDCHQYFLRITSKDLLVAVCAATGEVWTHYLSMTFCWNMIWLSVLCQFSVKVSFHVVHPALNEHNSLSFMWIHLLLQYPDILKVCEALCHSQDQSAVIQCISYFTTLIW